MSILLTPRLHLRPITFEDAPALHGALSDETTMRYWSSAPKSSLAETRSYMAFNVKGEAGPCWAITRRESPEQAMGWVILMTKKPGIAEIGFILVPSQAGRGYGYEACKAVMDHGFQTGLRRIFADIDPDNAASIALVKKLGFLYEGRHRAAWDTHIGIRDSVIYAKLSSDAERPASANASA